MLPEERGMGNGETGNGEQGTGNRKRGTGNGEQETGNGKRGTGNGGQETGDRKRRAERKENVQWTFLAMEPGGARGL